MNYPGLLGLDDSRAQGERLRDEALSAIDPFGERGTHLSSLCEYLSTRTK